MDISVKEAAEELGVSQQRVRDLARNGALVYRRAGARSMLIDRDSIQARKAYAASAGRRLSERSCWAVILAASAVGIPDLSRAERARARARLVKLPESSPGQFANRAKLVPMRCHPGLLERLRSDPRLALGGREAAARHDADIILGDAVDAYVSNAAVEELREQFQLAPARMRDANVILRAVAYAPALPAVSGVVIPPALLALDLIDAGDERSVRAGRQLLSYLAQASGE